MQRMTSYHLLQRVQVRLQKLLQSIVNLKKLVWLQLQEKQLYLAQL